MSVSASQGDCSLLPYSHYWIASKRIVTQQGIISGAVEVKGGKIISIVKDADWNGKSKQVVDYGNAVVMPGLIDVHVHLDDPGRDEWEGFPSGTKAAAAGGITTVVDMPLNNFPSTVSTETLNLKIKAAEKRIYVDVGFWGGLVPENAFNATTLEALLDAGVLGLKSFMCPSGINDFPMTDIHHIKAGLSALAKYRRPLLVHSEIQDDKSNVQVDNGGDDPRSYSTYLKTRPPSWEEAAIRELLTATKDMRSGGPAEGAHLHIVHLSDASSSLDLIKDAKKRGDSITVETCPHYLAFSAEEIPDGDTRFKCAPPIRDAANKEKLWNALMEGDIDMLSSDHSPSVPKLKLLNEGNFLKAWGGISSIQFVLPVTWSSGQKFGITLEKIALWWSERPAKLIGQHSKGAIAIGNHADIVVWEPEVEFDLNADHPMYVKNPSISAYLGKRLSGNVLATFVRGNLVYKQGNHAPAACVSVRPLQFNFKPKLISSVTNSLESRTSELATTLQSETLKTLEWPAICNYLSTFTSTSMGLSLTKTAAIPVGQSPDESQRLLDQTTAALHAMEAFKSEPLDLSSIEDVSGIVHSAASGQMLTVRELCRVRRMLAAARAVSEKLGAVAAGGSSERYTPLLEILQSCNFQMELEKKIGFCIDCNLSTVLDRASDELELIRAERKRNMENLDSLLKEVSVSIYQSGGIDRPLVTKRRSRMCVGVRASHKYLLPDGVVLNVSSSGATYFMEPREAVELNNMEVKLSNSEKAEEMAILSMLTSDITESEAEIRYLLDRLLEVDLAFARAAYARWVNGVCPILISEESEVLISEADNALSVDIEGIQHPLLLGSSLGNFSDFIAPNSVDPSVPNEKSGRMDSLKSSKGVSSFPVPIDIKVQSGTRVVVISGPNTGGKTASMKTLGLASIMSKAGMYLPAKRQPRVPWFDLVLADIGDSQSLEQSLSTFSGHISRICEILEVASKESLVLIDEIGSGTDPSEGVALSTSILQYLKNRVNLAVVTTHYADLSRLKDNDSQFENAAMEFSLETLQPTYQIIWGSTGDSYALAIANSIGFDRNIIERAKNWVESLKPEKQQERKGVLYQSLMEERNRLEAQFKRAESLHAEIMGLYNEVRGEADNLEEREIALRAKEMQKVQQELDTAKSQINTVVQEFENQLRIANSDEFNSLIRKSESAINSIVKAHFPGDSSSFTESETSSYEPQSGEQVHVNKLGNKLATVVEASEDDNTVLVQYGKIRVRVEKRNVRPISRSKSNAAISSRQSLKRQRRDFPSDSDTTNSDATSYSPLIQTSKNTVDLRGMRVEEATHHLEMAIAARESNSVLFVVHGMGTGVIKELALEILGKNPRVVKYEQDDPMNYGRTVAYIK
ncbi:hypothetical protein COLO4_31493 [Corchorus olitorius]|uniref:allantoinase n=1 Tax=Corchorus olitorius TaxID=93759 RepID=A0A1R3H485_9ROSI|nr:hypothetical protein COLO4_31493 [Corchorus olitorius]